MTIENITQIYKDTYPIKLKLVTRILRGDKALAEDVVQETFTRAIKYLSIYNEKKGSLNTWINSILFNTLRDLQKEERICHETLREFFLYHLDDPAKPLFTPEYKLELQEEINQVVNEKHRRVLELFYLYGYSSKEISEFEEDITQTNVTTIVMRFRKQLEKDDF